MKQTIVFVVNDLATLKPTQTTWALAGTARALGHPVGFVAVRDLYIQEDGRVMAATSWFGDNGPSPSVSQLELAKALVWARLNPGRADSPRSIQVAIEALDLAESQGIFVRNSPIGMWRSGSKLSLMALPPSCRPRSLVTSRADVARSWDAQVRGARVLKPLIGTQGAGVRRVDDQPERSIEENDALDGVIVQDFIERAHEGDVRVHVVGGRVLTVSGRHAIVRRVPRPGEFRSNVALGGTPVAAEWTDELERVVALAGPALSKLGLWHVGLDVVGGLVVEINAFSPGGLTDASAFAAVDFVSALVQAFLCEAGQ